MNTRHINPGFAVTGQISVTDVEELSHAGYKTIICNRPDDEGPGQPRFADIEAAARKLGLSMYYIPVIPGTVTADNMADFNKAMTEAQNPVIAYCASGNRAANLYGLWQREQASARA